MLLYVFSLQPPMRESSIDLVALALTLHSKNLTVVQAGIRTLANLASTLQALAFVAMAGNLAERHNSVLAVSLEDDFMKNHTEYNCFYVDFFLVQSTVNMSHFQI